MAFVQKNGLKIDENLASFIANEALPGTGVESDAFFAGLSALIHDLGPKNRALLKKRDAFQEQIDAYYKSNSGGIDPAACESFLRDIGYIVPEGADFSVTTSNIDPEIGSIAGPQLVVPINNARFALNAANARWGSLYDALYGTDAISDEGGAEKTRGYNPVRGRKVIDWARNFLNESVKLTVGWEDVGTFAVKDGALAIATLSGQSATLAGPARFCGFSGDAAAPDSLVFEHNNLHIRVVIDAASPTGGSDKAHISDVILESAITAIMDCEDSIAAVDAEDKIGVYRNWLGLMKGDLEDEFIKDGKPMRRRLNPDIAYKAPDGPASSLRASALMLIRNVGHLMTNPAIVDGDGNEAPEGIMDAAITALIALHDIGPKGLRKNSPAGSMYIVKPKMHGPEEVAFAVEIFSRVEADPRTCSQYASKSGIMDEERRTTVNLKECIRAAQSASSSSIQVSSIAPVTKSIPSMEAGPMIRKGDMKEAAWIGAYENWNVDIGLECGLPGHAQIGKGMWAMPDLMAAMLEQKIAHPRAGANTAWVPSPTAATLHATHYHRVNVGMFRQELASRGRAELADILSIPVATRPNWTAEEIQLELDNNSQGILGYVVRWIDQGVGCSKVPDINNVGLMEDRATLRISAQHMANWLRHGVVTREQIIATMKKMALVVDGQNKGDGAYTPMAADYDGSVAFQAALELVLDGRDQPNGYTEPVLHRRRLELKAKRAG